MDMLEYLAHNTRGLLGFGPRVQLCKSYTSSKDIITLVENRIETQYGIAPQHLPFQPVALHSSDGMEFWLLASDTQCYKIDYHQGHFFALELWSLPRPCSWFVPSQ
jgi:hypothetical protein